MNTVTVGREQLGYAMFALGRFIDYRLSEGMSESVLHGFMQAYLTLEAAIEGRESPGLRELQSQTVAVPPDLTQAVQTITPAWLPDGEKLRHIHRALDTSQCTNPPDAQA